MGKVRQSKAKSTNTELQPRRGHHALENRGLFALAVSIAFHAALMIVLTILYLAAPAQFGEGPHLIATSERLEEIAEGHLLEVILQTPDLNDVNELMEIDLTKEALDRQLFDLLGPEPQTGEANAEEIKRTPGEGLPTVRGVMGRGGSFAPGGGLGGRARRRQGVVGDGVTSRSEEAVERGLAWLAAMQCKDGGWNFDFEQNDSLAAAGLYCENGGTHGSRVAATSVAILAFLGAGYTPDHATGGKYWQTLDRGLSWLVKRAVPNELDGTVNYAEGYQGMYSQGLAVLALSEAHAMTQDNPTLTILKRRAQAGVDFIVKAQDTPVTGGWRYRIRETPGDMSVTAWQIMALKSAHLAGLDVPKPTLYRATDFLNMMQYDNGRQYRYVLESATRTGDGRGPDSSKTCTALGNLCRLYLGWQPVEPALDGGISLLKGWGPLLGRNECNLYYAYAATLAIHHHGSDGWEPWFTELREYLIATQARHGNESGSWYVPDYYSDAGGRLFNTALAIMILEVPYRYMPLYRGQETTFPPATAEGLPASR